MKKLLLLMSILISFLAKSQEEIYPVQVRIGYDLRKSNLEGIQMMFDAYNAKREWLTDGLSMPLLQHGYQFGLEQRVTENFRISGLFSRTYLIDKSAGVQPFNEVYAERTVKFLTNRYELNFLYSPELPDLYMGFGLSYNISNMKSRLDYEDDTEYLGGEETLGGSFIIQYAPSLMQDMFYVEAEFYMPFEKFEWNEASRNLGVYDEVSFSEFQYEFSIAVGFRSPSNFGTSSIAKPSPTPLIF